MAEIQEVAISINIDHSEINRDSKVPKELEIYMKKMLSELPGEPFDQRLVTIFRLPSSIHKTNKELCEPNLVSIGPYHHGKENLRTMEEHKWYILRDFLARNENVGLEDYLQGMRSIETEARNCYSETVDMGSDDFLMMLLLDGSLILEWFFLYLASRFDSFFQLGWATSVLFPDMCLLENQIPFFVLHKLFAIRYHSGVMGSSNCENDCPLLKLLFAALTEMFDFTPFTPPQLSCDNIHHLLHLCYTGVVPGTETQTRRVQKTSAVYIIHNFYLLGSFLWSKLYSKLCKDVRSEQNDCAPMDQQRVTIPCISELQDAGVRFKRKKKPSSLFDVSFENGTIEIPYLLMDTPKITILWNMVAFEQSRYPWGLPLILSSYFALMDALINDGKDVVILEQSGIIDNLCNNAEEAATLFNQFDKIFSLSYKDHYFKGLFEDVRGYSESMWHRYRARLIQDYFNNPWAIISLLAAGILLTLTFLQTYYSAAK